MKPWRRDLVRVGVLLLADGLLLYAIDPANIVIFQSVLVGLFLVGGTHVSRRILFPRLDLQLIAKKAYEENSMPAAIVFVAFIFFLVAVMFMPMSILS
jgi:hypothetical protein